VSFRCDGTLFHSPGPAAANALSPKVLYVRVTTHVRLAVERSRRSRSQRAGVPVASVADGAPYIVSVACQILVAKVIHDVYTEEIYKTVFHLQHQLVPRQSSQTPTARAARRRRVARSGLWESTKECLDVLTVSQCHLPEGTNVTETMYENLPLPEKPE